VATERGPDPATTFVAPPGALAAWVVDDGAGPVGQAVLTPGHDAGSLGWAELTGLPLQHHAVVSRVLTAVTARGPGGRAGPARRRHGPRQAPGWLDPAAD